MPVKIHLFGAFRVTVDAQPVTEFRSDKTRALLAYLALEGKTPLRRSALAKLLWSGYPAESARSSLRMTLSNLNRLFKDYSLLKINYYTVQFIGQAPDCWCDVQRVEALWERDTSTLSPNEQATLHTLLRQQFLQGLDQIDSPPFVDWLQACRERYGNHPLALPTTPMITALDNLPVPVNRLIGRAADLATAGALLAAPHVRLVTLVGPPGVGKSRLALAVATQARSDFAQGVVFVSLAAAHDPDQVATAIMNRLNLQSVSTRSPVNQLTSFLRDQQLLLLLDNFEQVSAAGPLVAELLAAAPKLKVLITSRVTLHLSGEWEYVVAPLATTGVDTPFDWKTAEQAPAVALFVERAQAVRPGFQLSAANAAAVAELCRRLDGLPLAIELAAARSRIFSPQALLERFTKSAPATLQLLSYGARDLPERHRTLLNAVQWSYAQLSAVEQRLFAQLGLFVGGFTLEAASAVCAASAEMVETLLAHSLLQHSEHPNGVTRFVMLEPLRLFALVQLEESGQTAALRQRYACYFAQWVPTQVGQLYGPHQFGAIEQLRSEQANWQAALTWAEAQALPLALELATALSPFWILAGNPVEGYGWLLCLTEQGATQPEVPALVYAQARLACHELALLTGQPLPLLAEQARLEAICHTANHLPSLGRLAWLGGKNLVDRSDSPSEMTLADRYSAAGRLLYRALALFEQVGDPICIAAVCYDLGFFHLLAGQVETSLASYQRAWQLYQEAGDRLQAAQVTIAIALNCWIRQDYTTAIVHCEEALSLFQQMRSQSSLAYGIAVLALCLVETGQLERGQMLIREGEVLARVVQNPGAEAIFSHTSGLLAERQGRLTEAVRLYGQNLVAAAQTTGNTFVIVSLFALCELLTTLQEDHAALYGLQIIQAWRAANGGQLPVRWQVKLERLLGLLPERLGPQAVAGTQLSPGGNIMESGIVAWVHTILQRVNER